MDIQEKNSDFLSSFYCTLSFSSARFLTFGIEETKLACIFDATLPPTYTIRFICHTKKNGFYPIHCMRKYAATPNKAGTPKTIP